MKFMIVLCAFLVIMNHSACDPSQKPQQAENKTQDQKPNQPENETTDQNSIMMNRGLKQEKPVGYDFSKPIVFKMPQMLDEISGIAFFNGKKDTVYAVQDEEGLLFSFPLGQDKNHSKKFAKKGDYEDLAILHNYFVILKSEGGLTTFPRPHFKDEKVNNVLEINTLLPQGEYEGLYADAETSNLYALCKECLEAKTSKKALGYILKMATNGKINANGQFSIDVKDIESKVGDKKIKFKPSALAKNKKTNEWYVLSSTNHLLVVTDLTWAVKEVYKLDPSVFQQPEGMAFDSENNLYISNERGDALEGNILKFIYQK
jgi:hypothetical protein